MKLKFGSNIIFDEFDTWPLVVLNKIKEHEKTLLSYYQEFKRIDKLAENNVQFRISRPHNIYEESWKSIIKEINQNLKDFRLIGFHCTRLVDEEIEDIKQNGLRPLDEEFTATRILRLTLKKQLSKKTSEKLLKNNISNDKGRNGNFCFFHCLSTFQDEWGLYRLFRSWGGEGIFIGHEIESDFETGTELSNIGTPCIVISSLDLDDVGVYPSLGEKMVETWIKKTTLDSEEYCTEFDSIIKNGGAVLKIIKFEDSLFEELTHYNQWRFKIN